MFSSQPTAPSSSCDLLCPSSSPGQPWAHLPDMPSPVTPQSFQAIPPSKPSFNHISKSPGTPGVKENSISPMLHFNPFFLPSRHLLPAALSAGLQPGGRPSLAVASQDHCLKQGTKLPSIGYRDMGACPPIPAGDREEEMLFREASVSSATVGDENN